MCELIISYYQVNTQTTRRRQTETELSLRARGIQAEPQILILHSVPRKRRRRRAWELLHSWKRRRKIKKRRRRPKQGAIVDFKIVNFERFGADKCWDIWRSELDWVVPCLVVIEHFPSGSPGSSCAKTSRIKTSEKLTAMSKIESWALVPKFYQEKNRSMKSLFWCFSIFFLFSHKISLAP